VAKLDNNNCNSRVTELSPVPLNRVMVVLRLQLAQELDKDTALKEEPLPHNSNKGMVLLRLEVPLELDKVMVLKEELPSSNRATVGFRPQLALELDKDMAVHQTVSKNQPILTTETETLNLLHPLHPTNKRLNNSTIIFYRNANSILYV
jgi:hypothetical protein